VEGAAGDDANLYDVTLSLREHRNLPPDGLEIFSFAPSLRVPDEDLITELRFLVPEDAERLTIRNFDAADADVALATAFRSVPLAASGQDEWQEAEVALEDEERGAPAAVVFGGGAEMPNDVTFEIRDQDGRELPIQLAAKAWRPNARPLPEADIGLLVNCFSVAFDASRSSDPDGEQLSYLWEFGDGESASGRAVVHTYDGPGTYRATLRVSDASGQVGAGAKRDFEVFVKRPPIAVAGDDLVVAPGESVAFVGTRSLDGERPIARSLESLRRRPGGGSEREPRLRAARPLHRHPAGRGRHRAALQLLDRSADRPGQRGAGRGRGRRSAGVGRPGDRAGSRPQLRYRRRDRRLLLGSGRRHHARRPVRPPRVWRARDVRRHPDGARRLRRRQRHRHGRLRGRGQRAADRRGRAESSRRHRGGDHLRCRRLGRSGRGVG
jgi:PKD domain